ncbi:conserved protein of unknown function [Pseudomonas marincola]|uniref:Uncharacterized protein n=1 Tax=Pseudomonas marincola TaxID=437900 RepID=A0A653DXX4_9PSED|nr:conserved protein of unknown function [Pseudomonas marincola]
MLHDRAGRRYKARFSVEARASCAFTHPHRPACQRFDEYHLAQESGVLRYWKFRNGGWMAYFAHGFSARFIDLYLDGFNREDLAESHMFGLYGRWSDGHPLVLFHQTMAQATYSAHSL